MSRLESLRGLHIIPVKNDPRDTPLGLSLEITPDWESQIRVEILRVFQPSEDSLLREILEDNGLIIFRHLLLTNDQKESIPSVAAVPDPSALILPQRTPTRRKGSRYLLLDSSQAPKRTKILHGEKVYTHHWERDQTLMVLETKEPQRKSQRNRVIA